MRIEYKPGLSVWDIEYYLDMNHERRIQNEHVYGLVTILTDLAFPSRVEKHDRHWENFFLPVRRNGRVIVIPLVMTEYKENFYAYVHRFGTMEVTRGDADADKTGELIFLELLRFIPMAKSLGKDIQKLIPCDIRTGKIKGRHVMERLLAPGIKSHIHQVYKAFLLKSREIQEISLDEYLETAALCYRAAFLEEAGGKAPIEMYKKWADRRDGGMLALKYWDSRKEFHQWLRSGEHAGSHPFEIVYSWHEHGIHLYPPARSSPYYKLCVTNYAYADDFIHMTEALIDAEVPFRALELEKVLDFLSGDIYFTVNDYGEHSFSYIPSREYRKKYYPHIEWDEVKTLEWKVNDGDTR